MPSFLRAFSPLSSLFGRTALGLWLLVACLAWLVLAAWPSTHALAVARRESP